MAAFEVPNTRWMIKLDQLTGKSHVARCLQDAAIMTRWRPSQAYPTLPPSGKGRCAWLIITIFGVPPVHEATTTSQAFCSRPFPKYMLLGVISYYSYRNHQGWGLRPEDGGYWSVCGWSSKGKQQVNQMRDDLDVAKGGGDWLERLIETFLLSPNLLIHYYDNFIMIPSTTPCPTSSPTHNLVARFDSAAWGNLNIEYWIYEEHDYYGIILWTTLPSMTS